MEKKNEYWKAVVLKNSIGKDERDTSPVRGSPQFYCKVRVVAKLLRGGKSEPLAEPFEVPIYYPCYVADKETGEVVPWQSKIRSLMSTFGWDAKTWSGLNKDHAGLEISLQGSWSEPQAGQKRFFNVKWINPLGGIRALSEDEINSMDREYALDMAAKPEAKKPAAKTEQNQIDDQIDDTDDEYMIPF